MVSMYHSFLIHSSADGHLGCFHVLAMINRAAMNIGVHVSLSDLVSLVCMPRSGIAGSYGHGNAHMTGSMMQDCSLLFSRLWILLYFCLPFKILLKTSKDTPGFSLLQVACVPYQPPMALFWKSKIKSLFWASKSIMRMYCSTNLFTTALLWNIYLK